MSADRAVVVVPAYNEADRLDADAFEQFLAAATGVTIGFVDDGSTDQTAARCAAIVARHPDRAWLLQLPANRGKAEAVRLGMLRALDAGAPLVGFLDADLSAPLGEVAILLEELDRHPGAWAAIGSRVRLLGRDIERSAARHYLGRVFATAASLVLGLPVYDAQCGLKLFRNLPGVRAALAEPFRSRWIFDVELLARLAAQPGIAPRTDIREVPLEQWHARSGSRLGPGDFWRAPRELLAIRRQVRRS